MSGGGIVLDPGHGGAGPRGAATPVGAVGRGGLREKDLALAMAQEVRARLALMGVPATLTRSDDRALGLRERVAAARDAALFVSLHANWSDDPFTQGTELWVHRDAPPPSHHLASELSAALGALSPPAPRLLAGPLAVLDTQVHAPGTRACLVELGYLSNDEDERRLADGAHRRRLAGGMAVALSRALAPRASHEVTTRFDVWHEVPLVPQLTGMSCWAAAAAMLLGWRECIPVDAEEIAAGLGRWEAYRDGLEPRDVEAVAARWGLIAEPPRTYTPWAMKDLLERYGPLWVGAASPGLHVVVVAGLHGDGTPDGTFARVADPWPVGQGERYTISFRELAQNLADADRVFGLPARILRTDGHGGARRRVVHQRREIWHHGG